MADGGEGTARAMISACNGRWVEKSVTGPLYQMRVKAGFAVLDDTTALVEMASASGLELLKANQRNPYKTTTYGTGELIAAAVDFGAKKIFLAVGGSATVDGGTGAAAALGWGFLDENDERIMPCGGRLLEIRKIVPPEKETTEDIEVLCDVDNPLCGPYGAARIYGPQKGATPQMVEKLEEGLLHLAGLIREQIGLDVKDLPGAGAAGGLAAGAVAFMNASIVSGIETVIEYSGLKDAIKDADWVITGEGKFDSQSLRGKVVSGVAQLTRQTSAKTAIIAGQLALSEKHLRDFGIDEAFSCMDSAVDEQYAIENAEALLADAAKRFAKKLMKNR
jgi:glycerate kinase